MAKLRAHNIAMSLDGYTAGPNQDLNDPMGVGGMGLHQWAFKTASFGADHAGVGGETGVDNDFIVAGDVNVGATIMGRNMFGPVRGDWGDDSWKGWWGPNPPYHHDVFVLTRHAHDPMPMDGGTTFNFVTDGIEAALKLAMEAANGKDVRVGGGASVIRAYLNAGLLDELHIAVVPILLGDGSRLFEAGVVPIGYEVASYVPSKEVAHMTVRKRA